MSEKSIIVMITDRCNMGCAHCANTCTTEGDDMAESTFAKVCERLSEAKDLHKISISGGEPTLHPLFWEFVKMALATGHRLQVSTNGSIPKSSLKLASYAQQGRLEARLSRTRYHNKGMVKQKVLKAFSRKHPNIQILQEDFMTISKTGRAKQNEIGENFCYWNFGPVIDPNGDIYSCGCRTEKLGSVFDEENFLLADVEPCSTFGDTATAVEAIVQKNLLQYKTENPDKLNPTKADIMGFLKKNQRS